MPLKNHTRAITMADRIHQAMVKEINSELRRRDLKTRALSINTKVSPETLLIELSDGSDSEEYLAGLIFKEARFRAVELVVRSRVKRLVVGKIAKKKKKK